MLEKIRKLGNLPLVIILILVVIIAIILSVAKVQKTEQTNVNNQVSDVDNQENIEDDNEIIVTEIIDEEQTEITEKPKEPEEKEEKNIKYYIKVNYGQNVVTIYTKDSKGNYTVPYKSMVCSTGSATPKSGTYTIPSISENKYPRGTWGMMIGGVWAQYFTRITGSILFHSVPYTERNKGTLKYLEYDKLGTTASAGCIRLTVQDAKWIYNNCPAGTKVEFYTDSNPGPLGKPKTQKISEEEAVRGWDPTDPDKSNPWKTYTPNKNGESETPKEEIPTTNPSVNPTAPTGPSTSTTPDESKDKENTSGGETTKPNEGDNSGGETTKPNEGNNSGGETTKPNEGNNSGGETTKPSEGNNSGGETTKPSEGNNSGGETTKPSEGNSSGGETTKSNESNNSGEETTKQNKTLDKK